ncbi:hypothetical protein M9H77_22046 [Catharanthus roseus]|uniref:Uncharacterized protein n=1 Tax=Catharanthus roseus TaxID=4058 RepID=A0ACC0ATE9_CATRO|nr:hypothetical protein M9H77_22046 [Catharanthus roseus]
MPHDPHSISTQTHTHDVSSLHQGLWDSDVHVLGLPPSTLYHKVLGFLYRSPPQNPEIFVLHGPSSSAIQHKKNKNEKKRRKEGEEEEKKRRKEKSKRRRRRKRRRRSSGGFLEKKKMKTTVRVSLV